MGANPGAASVWVLLIVLAIGTFGLRLSFIQLSDWLDALPPAVERGMAFVPAAILAALVIPELISLDGAVNAPVATPRLLAGGIAAVVAWRTGSMFFTIIVGMSALWVAKFIMG